MDNLMEGYKSPTDWLGLVSPGVFAIVDRGLKQVFVSCSNNLVKGIADVVTKIRRKDHVCSHMTKPEVLVLYLGNNQKFEGAKSITAFELDGWQVLNVVMPIRLNAKVRILPMGEQNVIVVTLRSARGNEKIVAAFEDMATCEEWFSEHYPNGYVTKVVTLDNELSVQAKEYFGQR